MNAELELGLVAAEDSASRHAAEIAMLVPLARELALKAHPEGITVANLRIAATQRGLLPDSGSGRELSFLGAVMRKAGLRATGQRRRSHVPGTHGNVNVVWVAEGGQT